MHARSSISRIAQAVALLVALGSARETAAETRSWAAIKDRLPGTASLVVSMDLTQNAGWFWKMRGLLGEGLHKATAAIQPTCGVDPLVAITDVTIVDAGNGDQMLGAFGLADGIDEVTV